MAKSDQRSRCPCLGGIEKISRKAGNRTAQWIFLPGTFGTAGDRGCCAGLWASVVHSAVSGSSQAQGKYKASRYRNRPVPIRSVGTLAAAPDWFSPSQHAIWRDTLAAAPDQLIGPTVHNLLVALTVAVDRMRSLACAVNILVSTQCEVPAIIEAQLRAAIGAVVKVSVALGFPPSVRMRLAAPAPPRQAEEQAADDDTWRTLFPGSPELRPQ